MTVTESEKETKVFTNGCFDVFHLGHLKLLKFAKSMGDTLIVGINSDKSFESLKGRKPKNSEQERKELLELLGIADQVIVFDELTPIHLIKQCEPDIIVKGQDYSRANVVGSELAKVVIYNSHYTKHSSDLTA